MGDTFGDSFNRALNMAHILANNRRMEEAAQYQNTMQQLQFAKYAQELVQQEQSRSELQSLFKKDEKGNMKNPSREDLIPWAAKWRPQLLPELMKGNEEKEVNVGNDIDTILGGKFPGYYTDKGVRKLALEYYAAHPTEVRAEAAKYAREKAPPSYTAVLTSQGLVPFQTRGPEAGSFKLPEGPEEPKKKPLPEPAMKEFGALSSLRQMTVSADKLFKSGYVGPVAGRYYGVKEQVFDMPEEQVKFYSYVRDIKDALLRARSGAQINEQEYARLVKFLPDENLPPANFKARMMRFQEAIDTLMLEKARVYSAQGFELKDINTGAPQADWKGPALGGQGGTNTKATLDSIFKPKKR